MPLVIQSKGKKMKTGRINTRVTQDVLSIINQAAKASGYSVSEYMRIAATEKAKRDLKKVGRHG